MKYGKKWKEAVWNFSEPLFIISKAKNLEGGHYTNVAVIYNL